jgi:uncharacterized protein (DUF58 family)
MTTAPSATLAPPTLAAKAVRRGIGFAFGPRFFLLIALGMLWLAPAFWNVRFLYGTFLWDAIVILAWLADLLQLPKPSQITLERYWPHPPALLRRSHVEIRVQGPRGLPLTFRVIDNLPPALRVEQGIGRGVTSKYGDGSAQVEIYPQERGEHKAQQVFIKYRSEVALAERWAVADLTQSVRVYPDLRAASGSTIHLTRSRRIEFERRLQRQRGMGREFESLREYQPGDEFRDICWTATARRGKFVTVLHQMERSQPVWIIMDAGRLLRARVGELSKLDCLVNSALSVSQLAMQSDDRIGLLTYGRGIQQRIPLGRGAGHMRLILDALAQVKTEASEADHLRAVSVLQGMQPRRSLVIWMTDLAETAMTPEVIEAATLLSRRHLLLFVVAGQPELSTAANARPENVREMFEGSAAQELIQRREVLMRRMRDHGALTVEAPPEGLSAALLNQYLHVKEQSLL